MDMMLVDAMDMLPESKLIAKWSNWSLIVSRHVSFSSSVD